MSERLDGKLVVMKCNEEPVGFTRRLKWRLKRAGRAIRGWRFRRELGLDKSPLVPPNAKEEGSSQ
jgi:hypothetical protein